MNWLEVGCPHCPSVLTLSPAAAGRTICCPDCERLYLVPTPDDTPHGEPKQGPSDMAAMAASPKPAPPPPPTADDEPRVAVDSPLPELPILAAPLETAAMQSAASQFAAPSPSSGRPPPIPPQLLARPEGSSKTLAALLPPKHAASDSVAESDDDARLRMRRAELRARANLIVFVVGVLVMSAFAAIVVRLSRR